jgi:hypothetical protein
VIFWSPWISLAERSCSSFALVVFPVCRWGTASSFRWCRRGLSVGCPNWWGLDSILGSSDLEHRWMAFSFRAKRMFWSLREIASTNSDLSFEAYFWLQNSFYITNTWTLSCNNFYLNYSIWYCTYVCWLCSRFIENRSSWSWSMNPFTRWFCHSWWGSLSPYKDYSSLLRGAS